jgi:hypothetical protein
MHYLKQFLLSVFALAAFAGCKCHDEACRLYPENFVRLIGFDSSEQSLIIVRRWDTTGFYTRLVDTAIYNANTVNKPLIGTINDSRFPWAGYDIEIVIPAIPRTIRFYDFRYEARSQQVCPGFNKKEIECTNPLLSYTQEGAVHLYNPDSQSYFIINK